MKGWSYRLAPGAKGLIRNQSRSTRLEVVMNPLSLTYTSEFLEPGEEMFVFGEDGRVGRLFARWVDPVDTMPPPEVVHLELG
jgi:hypothetical protein